MRRGLHSKPIALLAYVLTCMITNLVIDELIVEYRGRNKSIMIKVSPRYNIFVQQ